ncbi:MAG: hypothetical protein FJW83_07810 [Actinobacteria bacterium]|nr:hypothetical protein [Actinomycetota bacterium]
MIPVGARVVAYVPDLGDRSRIDAAVAGVRHVGRVEDLAGVAADADVVLVDLRRPGALEAAAAVVGPGRTVIGFAPHVDDDRLGRAREAGLTEVLPRSLFFHRVSGGGRPPTAP